MRVDLRGGAQTRVPELGLRSLERFAEVAEQRCMRVPEAVPRNCRQACSLTSRLKDPPQQIVRVQWRTVPASEYKCVSSCCIPAFRQALAQQGAHRNVTDSAFGFRRRDIPLINRFTNVNEILFEIHVFQRSASNWVPVPRCGTCKSAERKNETRFNGCYSVSVIC